MNPKLKLVLTILFLLSINKLYCQIATSKGYIITNAADTVYGRLEYSNMGYYNKCIFIKEGTSAIQILRPTDIQEFFISPGMRFVTHHINGKKSFYRVLSEGTVNLYYNSPDFLISCHSDTLIQLEGGSKIIEKEGKTYARESEIYKKQIKHCINDTSYYSRINKLYFDKDVILKFFQDFNNKTTATDFQKAPVKISGRNQFAFELGYAVNTFELVNSVYDGDSLTVSYDNNQDYSSLDPSSVLHDQKFLQVGINYKRKISRSNSYFSIGLRYNRAVNTELTRKGLFYRYYLFSLNGNSGFVGESSGNVTDKYDFDISYISIPISYHIEMTRTKLRPFIDLGVSNAWFLNRDITVSRQVNIHNVKVEDSSLKFKLPTFSFGINLGFGFRYVINMNNSITAGFNIVSFSHNSNSDIYATYGKGIVCSFGF